MTKEQKRLMTYIAIIVAAMFIISFAYVFSISKPASNNLENGISVSDSTPTENNNSIINVLNNYQISSFSSLIESNNFEKEISNSEQMLTILVPVDSAFSNTGDFDPVTLIQSLTIPKLIYSNTLQLNVPIATSLGSNITFTSEDGEIYVVSGEKKAKVLNADINFEKGNIFLIDSVLN
ncbi:fasciclin domain-containing protein [Candidatus Dojkabacteria bacterium]|uniref:Fasciclin domain-containing protein n=1 Tax=Candidatus Dojkabacteria bacterium TaxID=2099670 RepID=A0A955I914_9BACT|nr:fasciclin domain-containing protein [Candidatus Dojkabacteria bacterium]